VDGHDLEALEQALHRAADRPDRWCCTSTPPKGRGYGPAELDEEKCLHDVGPFDPETGVALDAAGRGLSYTEAFGSALVREAAAHPEIVAITAAMPGPTGLIEFRDCYLGTFLRRRHRRAAAVNAAAGMAMARLAARRGASTPRSSTGACDQVYYDVGLHRLR